MTTDIPEAKLPAVSLLAVRVGWPLCVICGRPCSPWSPDYCRGHWPAVMVAYKGGRYLGPWEGAEDHYFEFRQRMALLQGKKVAQPGRKSGLFAAIKSAVPVEELAGRFTELRRSGPNTFKGRCPLHEERTGSFVIYEDRQYWRCFGACARGGDVIELARLLMDKGLLGDAKQEQAVVE